MSKNILICIDRDGTLLYDKKYYLGKQRNWRELLKILPNVVKGISLLNKKLPKAKIYMITNQSGVAIKSFPLLTEKRAELVCQTIIKKLKNRKAIINDYIICPYVNKSYVSKHKDQKFNKSYICNCSCIKPNPGMIKKALKLSGFSPKNTNIYVIGDRFKDIETAHALSATGILIPFENESNEDLSLLNKDHKNEYLASDMEKAAKFIIKEEFKK